MDMDKFRDACKLKQYATGTNRI